MGDAENTLPPSKKRAAGRELSRDNPGLDDENEDVFDQETGTFKRASEEVLANRKIVKIRRNRTPSAPPAPSSSNPFASICLIPPKDSVSDPATVTNVQETTETGRETVESRDDAKKESGNDVQETGKTARETVESQDDAKKESGISVQETTETARETVESRDDAKKESGNNVQETTETGRETVESRDDAKKESGNNVQESMETGRETVESRDDAKKESGNDVQETTETTAHETVESRDDAKTESGNDVQEATETARETVESRDDAKTESGKKKDEEKHDEVASDVRKPESGDPKKETGSNGIENDENKIPESVVSVSSFQQLSSSQNAFTGLIGPGFSSSTFSFGSITKNNQPVFSSFGFGSNGNPSSKIPTTEEVQVETGEENEKTVFTADSVLFEFLDNGWKERGKGEVKVNVSRTGTGKGRLVMRSKGNYRLILNANLFADMKLTKMEKKGITFACLNSNGEGQNGLSTFALKFKDAAIVEEFCGMVTEHKGNNNDNNVPLKTPENSP